MVVNYQAAYERLLRSMQGIQACGTKCPCCEMLRRIADNAVREAPLLLEVPSVPAGTTEPEFLPIPDFLRSGDD
jgi:hypothetical protein